MKYLVKRTSFILMTLVVLFIAYVFLAGHVSKELTNEDKIAVQKLGVDAQCLKVLSFDDEIRCVKAIQNAITELVSDTRCADRGTTIEPQEFLKRSFGCCYDRARFTEKSLSYYGFKTRHVAIYDRTKHGALSIFVPGISSHATSEVLTKKGWMGVDSNEPFILLTTENQVITFNNFKSHEDQLKYPMKPKGFYSNELLVVYGLFSRHGMFHGPNLPTIEFNFGELHHNF